MLRSFIIVITFLSLVGCEIMGPSVKVEGPKVKLDPAVKVEVESDKKGKFCPPGQAKKGNC